MINHKERFNGYKNYLLYKKTLERFAQGDCGRREIAQYTGVHINSTLYMFRVLEKEKVIKRASFEIAKDGTKRMIYTLVKPL